MKNLEIPEIITDEWIISNLTNKNRLISGSIKFINSNDNLNVYVQNRYNDSDTINETLYRIINKIEEKPKCKICGKPLQFRRNGYPKYCSPSCANYGSIEKRKENSIKKWGVDNPNKAILVKEKAKHHFLEKYGVTNPSYIEDVKILRLITAAKNNSYKKAIKKREESKQIKYGNKNYVNSEKAKHTNIEKYGVDNPAKSNIIKEKIKQTNITKYGVKSVFLLSSIHSLAHSDNANNKRYETMKNNHTFNTSKVEQLFKLYLEENYKDDFEYQYRSELYPFNCDFYIKSLDLYIEIQGSWTHGNHAYNSNNNEDINRLLYMQSKHTKFYDKAIDVWTVKDPYKRKIAKENHLNYLEIFSCNIDECLKIFNDYIVLKSNQSRSSKGTMVFE